MVEIKNIFEVKFVFKEDIMDIEDNNKGINIILNFLILFILDLLFKDKIYIKLENFFVSSCGMLDRIRVVLFVFMFVFIFVNSLSYLFF